MAKSKSIEHVAIIMDGNGRWAAERAHRRVWGHIRGSNVVNDIVEAADEMGCKALTLYAFSTENFSRPQEEITTLFRLLKKFIKRERKRVMEKNLRFKIIGDISALPEDTQKLISSLERDSMVNKGMWLNFAFSYGGRVEIIDAINSFIEKNPGEQITEESFAANLYNPEAGDVDLMIRTGGDQRISNFLLWQVAYGELYFTPNKWPEFTKEEFYQIFEKVSGRERRFGSVAADLDYDQTSAQAKLNKELLK
ncbi:MAG: di-trans,poly-cis-decaprenylcistransferase [Bacteriovoracaceae bacterium]|nr:di-trans,poly-cis-decaprenylcistransferase [Bacteriovoracaceae bacterium]